MAPTPISVANTIARALNSLYKTHIVINTSQHYSGDTKLIRMYIVKDAFRSPKGEYSNKELFASASGVYTCLFMRDLLYTFQGRALEEETNEGYINVRTKRNADASIQYMIDTYLVGGKIDE